MIWRSAKIFSLPEIEQAFLRRQDHSLVALATADSQFINVGRFHPFIGHKGP